MVKMHQIHFNPTTLSRSSFQFFIPFDALTSFALGKIFGHPWVTTPLFPQGQCMHLPKRNVSEVRVDVEEVRELNIGGGVGGGLFP